MAVTYNTKIVTDGLVLCLDAANPRSYPGTGTTWYDLSGNGNNGTLTNGPTFDIANGGVIVLNQSNSTYIDISLDMSSSNYTVIGASRYAVSGNSGRTFSAKNNNWLMGHWNTTTENHYAEGWITSAGAGPNDTNWRIYAASGNVSGDSYNFYVNGSLNTGPSNLGSAGPNGFAIGSYATTSEFSTAHIGFMLVYNRVLSTAEVQQNFNALRGRYGL